MAPMNVPIKPGDVIRVGEADYCYGTGRLILRVTEVGPAQQQSDGPWISLCGLELRTDGSRKAVEPRHALVRLSAVRGRQ